MKTYTIRLDPPENDNQLWGAWCEELKLSAFGETKNEAFYNMVENIPIYFEIKNEFERSKKLRSFIEKEEEKKEEVYCIPAFA